jgi:D-beta-D-heptose 7-phosphate kinase/D-beta-D-heptose 1-phosphate adenosyltransferase
VNRSDLVSNRILEKDELIRQVSRWRLAGKSVCFTNGAFDMLHPGHLQSLSLAAAEADCLVVAVNSDASVKRLKGDDRPVLDQYSRAMLLASLVIVDAVIIFEEDTPIDLITAILPNVLAKGGDYKEDQIAGAKEVRAAGGRVFIHPLVEGWSTTQIIGRMKNP